MPKKVTLSLYYFVKYVELAILCIGTGVSISSTMWFVDKITDQTILDDQDAQAIIFSLVSLLLVIMNTFYNSLLINIRFLVKMKCVTYGICVFDCFNYLCCYPCLKKCCIGRCNHWGIIPKWLFCAGVMGYTIYLIRQKVDKWHEFEFQVGELDLGTTRLDSYLILFLLQIPIFFALRIVIFMLFSIFTCCCNVWDEDLPDGLELKERIISYDFVDYELGILNNFENHVIGRREMQFN